MGRSIEAERVWQEFSDFCEKNNLEDERREFLQYGATWPIEKGKFSDFPYQLEVVDRGGCWNDGGEIYCVVRIGDFFFKDTGYYSSWDSNHWESDWHEVKAVEKTIVEYE